VDLSSAFISQITSLRTVIRVSTPRPEEMVNEAEYRQIAAQVSTSENHHEPTSPPSDPRLIPRGDAETVNIIPMGPYPYTNSVMVGGGDYSDSGMDEIPPLVDMGVGDHHAWGQDQSQLLADYAIRQAIELEHARFHLSQAEAMERLVDLHQLNTLFNGPLLQEDDDDEDDPDYEPILDR
jgi:hypothetical protein